MPPLTQEQFQKARASGLSTEKIIEFEKRRLSEVPTEETTPLSYEEEIIQKEQERRTRLEKTPLGKTAYRLTDYFYPQAMTEKKFEEGEHNLLGDISTRPARAIRSAIFPKEGENRIAGYMRGAVSSPEPTNLKEGITDIVADPTNYLLGAFGMAKKAQIGGMIGKGADTLTDIGKGIQKGTETIIQKTTNPLVNLSTSIKNVSKPAKFAGKVRNAFFDAKRIAGKEFEQGIIRQEIANPENAINLRPMFEDFKSIMDDVVNNPGLKSEIKSIVRKSKTDLGVLIDKPELAENLTLKQAQTIKNAINQAPAIARKAGNKFANWTQGEGELLDLVDEIKLAELENFPGMENVFAKYADKMGQYRLIKNKFKEGSLVRNLKTGFGDPEIQNMVKAYFKDNPAIIKEMGGYEKTLKFLKAFGITVGGATGYEIIRRLLKGQQ